MKMLIAEQEDIVTLLNFDAKLKLNVIHELQLVYLAPWTLSQLTEFQRNLVANNIELTEPLTQSVELPSTMTIKFIKRDFTVLNRIYGALNSPNRLLAGFIYYRLLYDLSS